MTALSIFGLGFQSLLISVLLIAGLKEYVIAIIIGLTVFTPVFVSVRKNLG